MDFNRFTEKLQEAVRAAQSLATTNGNQQVEVEHLLLALLEQPGVLAPSLLTKADVKVDTLRSRLQQGDHRLRKVSGTSYAPHHILFTHPLTNLFYPDP